MILAKIRSLRWADFYLFALLDPRSLYRQIAKKDPDALALSFSVPAMVAIIDILTMSIMGENTPFFYYKLTYGWILLLLIIVFRILIASSLMDLISQFLGYRGNIREILCLVNFSLLPHVFLLPAVYIFKVINFAPAFFYILFSFALTIWSALIAIQGLSEMHSVTVGRAVLIFLFPALLIILFLFFMIFLFFFGLFGYLL